MVVAAAWGKVFITGPAHLAASLSVNVRCLQYMHSLLDYF